MAGHWAGWSCFIVAVGHRHKPRGAAPARRTTVLTAKDAKSAKKGRAEQQQPRRLTQSRKDAKNGKSWRTATAGHPGTAGVPWPDGAMAWPYEGNGKNHGETPPPSVGVTP